MTGLTRHFAREEFACRCGCGCDDIDPELVDLIEAMRVALGRPLIVTSGVRCRGHNRSCGGSPTSPHLTGLAADLAAQGPAQRFELVRAAALAGFNRIGVGADFIHLDRDRDKTAPALWTY